MPYTGPKSNDPDTYMKDLVVDEHTALATPEQFRRLDEYSTSLPTGMYDGKRWKSERRKREGHRLVNDGWWLGEFQETPALEAKGLIGIIWRELLVVTPEPAHQRGWRSIGTV